MPKKKNLDIALDFEDWEFSEPSPTTAEPRERKWGKPTNYNVPGIMPPKLSAPNIYPTAKKSNKNKRRATILDLSEIKSLDESLDSSKIMDYRSNHISDDNVYDQQFTPFDTSGLPKVQHLHKLAPSWSRTRDHNLARTTQEQLNLTNTETDKSKRKRAGRCNTKNSTTALDISSSSSCSSSPGALGAATIVGNKICFHGGNMDQRLCSAGTQNKGFSSNNSDTSSQRLQLNVTPRINSNQWESENRHRRSILSVDYHQESLSPGRPDITRGLGYHQDGRMSTRRGDNKQIQQPMQPKRVSAVWKRQGERSRQLKIGHGMMSYSEVEELNNERAIICQICAFNYEGGETSKYISDVNNVKERDIKGVGRKVPRIRVQTVCCEQTICLKCAAKILSLVEEFDINGDPCYRYARHCPYCSHLGELRIFNPFILDNNG